MHWTSGASEAKDRSAAIEEAAAGLDADADLLVAFAAPELADAELSAVVPARLLLPPSSLGQTLQRSC